MTAARSGFEIVRKAAEILGREDAFTDGCEVLMEKLPPYSIGKYGQLMEWYRDYEEPLPDHRHTSHLLALHPFGTIDPEKEPELAEAVRISLDRRLGENAKDIVYANWAGALLILYYARLLDGERAGAFVKPMIAFLSRENMMITHQGSTSSVTGGIYELDGNTGFAAGVAEMLLQSRENRIRILPALPREWKTGEYKGMRAYGGHVVSTVWDEDSVCVTIAAAGDGELTVCCFDEVRQIELRKGECCRMLFSRKK